MPIETTAAGILDIENAKLRASQLIATQKIGIGEETAPTHTFQIKTPNPVMLLEEFNGSTSTSAGQLLASSGVLHIQSGTATSSDSKGDIAFSSIDGVTRHMTIVGSTGYVGIGTFTNPASHLHIQATAAELRLEAPSGTAHLELGGADGGYIDLKAPFADDNDVRIETTGSGANIKVSGNNSFGLWTDGSTRMTVTGTGNVGIGTTSPTYNLTVGGRIAAFNNGVYTPAIMFNSGSSNTNEWMIRANVSDTYAGEFTIGRSDTTSPSFLTILNNGNVGIGTTSPNSLGKLHVNGNVYVGNSNYLMSGYASTGDNQYFGKEYSGRILAGMEIENTTLVGNYSQKLHLRTHHYAVSEGRRFTINESGNVGIGNESPSHKLDVNGTIGISGRAIFPMLRWDVDLTAQSSANFYPIEFVHEYGTNGDMPPVNFKVYGKSLGGGDAFNENTLVGFARGGGWSDHNGMYDVQISHFVPTEHRFLGIYEGNFDYMEGFVIYMRGGYKYGIISDALSVVKHTTAYTTPGTNNSVFAIKNSSGTDVSGTSTGITELVNLTRAVSNERFIQGNLVVSDSISSIQPCVIAYPSTNTTYNDSDSQTIILGGTRINRGSMYNTSTGIITIPESGIYFFHMAAYTDASVLCIYDLMLSTNGGTTYYRKHRAELSSSSGNNSIATMMATIVCSANDLIYFRASGGSSVEIIAAGPANEDYTLMACYKLG